MNNAAAQSRIIGVVSDEFSNPYTLQLLNEVTRQLNARGDLTLLLNVTSRDQLQTALQASAQRPLAGLVFLTSVCADERQLVAAALPGVPTIHIASHTDDPQADVIAVEGYAAGAEIARLLLAQGHQRAGYMKSLHASPTHLQRMDGYASALATAEKPLEDVITAASYDREVAYNAMMAYLKQARASDRINALFCENDVLALGAMQAIRDFGQGAHIAVVGFDDISEAHAPTWHLTSWAQRSDLLVTEALSRLLEGKAHPDGAWRHGELQLRHSHLGKHVHGEMHKCGCAIRH